MGENKVGDIPYIRDCMWDCRLYVIPILGLVAIDARYCPRYEGIITLSCH